MTGVGSSGQPSQILIVGNCLHRRGRGDGGGRAKVGGVKVLDILTAGCISGLGAGPGSERARRTLVLGLGRVEL